MPDKAPPAKFVTFEGGEGSGKSTQIKNLAEFLEDRGVPVVVTREPGGAPDAEKIRAMLVTGEPGRWSPVAELLLMNAARENHLNHLIRPALAAGQWVLCDRFSDSSRAYQGIAGGVRRELVDQIEQAVVGETRPHLTFILDLDPEIGLARAGKRLDGPDESRFEAKGLDFHRRLRQGFLDIAAAEPERCVTVDATRPVDDVANLIAEIMTVHLLKD